MLVRGLPNLEGNKLRGFVLVGEVGIALGAGWVPPVLRVGDSERATAAGDADLTMFAGDAGRASRETDGLEGLCRPVNRLTVEIGTAAGVET